MGGLDMAMTAGDQHTLEVLLNQLDLGAQQAQSGEDAGDQWECHRKSSRHPFRAKCTLRFVSGGFERVAALPGRTRNLSRGGLAVIVRRVFHIDDPIEIEIRLPTRPTLFLAGVVTFCRYAGQGYHELGVALKVSSDAPIFSKNLEEAEKEYDWLAVSQTR
jgi:hypothetical protein